MNIEVKNLSSFITILLLAGVIQML